MIQRLNTRFDNYSAKDLFHGAALTQIVEHPLFTALNKVDDKYGHYLVNADIRLLVKYSSPSNSPWQFTFNESDLEAIRNDIMDESVKFFACLVCGTETVCLLTFEHLEAVIDLDSEDAQWVHVEILAPRKSMRVKGGTGKLKKTVAHNAFPNGLF